MMQKINKLQLLSSFTSLRKNRFLIKQKICY